MRFRSIIARSVSSAAFAMALTSMAHSQATDEVWTQRWDGTGGGRDLARAIVADPSGLRVFVTGQSFGSTLDIVTCCYDAVTGAVLWNAIYDGPGAGTDCGEAIAVSPNGLVVYVAGSSDGPGTDSDVVVLAYDAVTGTLLSSGRYMGTSCGQSSALPNAPDYVHDVVVSPDGLFVYVTGQSGSFAGACVDMVTLKFAASQLGELLWVSRYDGGRNDIANAMAISPDGSQVYVTGYSATIAAVYPMTVAYGTAEGDQRWTFKVTTPGQAYDIAVRPNGARVYITGMVYGAQGDDAFWAGMSAVNPSQFSWARAFDSPAHKTDRMTGIAVDPDGMRLYVTGYSENAGGEYDARTMCVEAPDGDPIWNVTYDGPAHSRDISSTVALAGANGDLVVVTGHSVNATPEREYLTYALNRVDGALRWEMRYNGPGLATPGARFEEGARAIAVSPDGRRVFITGASWGGDQSYDYGTVSYLADPSTGGG